MQLDERVLSSGDIIDLVNNMSLCVLRSIQYEHLTLALSLLHSNLTVISSPQKSSKSILIDDAYR